MLNTHRTVVFRGSTAAVVNAMQAAVERLVGPSSIKFSDPAKPDKSGVHSAITMIKPADVNGPATVELEMLVPVQVFKGNCEEVRRKVATFCCGLPKDAPSIVWSRVEDNTHISEVITDIPASFTEKKWADGYDRLPEEVNIAIHQMFDLYHNFGGYTARQNQKLSRKLSTHVNALLAMDETALAAWHADNISLIAAVKANPKLCHQQCS